MTLIMAIFVLLITLKHIVMKNQEKKLKELRSKETIQGSADPKWRFTNGNEAGVYDYEEVLFDQIMYVKLKAETKRGFTFTYIIAGKFIDIFISRSEVYIVYELD